MAPQLVSYFCSEGNLWSCSLGEGLGANVQSAFSYLNIEQFNHIYVN